MIARRLSIALCLALFLLGQASPLAASLLRAHGDHQCQCSRIVCICLHRHERKPAAPTCHSSKKTTQDMPQLKGCQSDDEQTIAAAYYLLAKPASLPQPLEQGSSTATVRVTLPSAFGDISPPPPRRLPS